MGLFRTILLALMALATIIVAVVQTQDGSLARLLGRGEFAEGENLFSFNPQTAHYFFLRTPDKEAKFHKKENGIWWADSPWNDRMDPRAAEAMLQFAIGTRVVDRLPLNNTTKGNLREFGVENGSVQILVKDKRERSLSRFQLGNTAPWIIPGEKEKDPITPTVYLKTDLYKSNAELFVVSGNISPLFKDGLRYLRDHRPLYFSPTTVNGVEIKTEDTNLSLNRKSEKDPWVVTKPMELEADQAIVTNLLGVLQQLTAIKVSDPDELTILEKESPKNKKITLSFTNGQNPVTLTILPPEKPDSQTVLALVSDRNAIFTLPVKSMDEMPGTQNLALSQKLLRSKQLAKIDRTKLNAIVLRAENEPFPIRLKKVTKTTWLCSTEGANFQPFNEIQLYKLLKTIETAPVADFATDAAVDPEPYGLHGETPYTITFGFEDRDPLRIRIGLGIDDKFYAMVGDKPSVLALSPEYIKELGFYSYMWKQLPLFQDVIASELEAISLTLPDSKDNLRLTYNYSEDEWKAMNGDKDLTPLINIHKTNNYLDTLARAQVKQWISASNKAAQEALKEPCLKITVEMKPEFATEGIATISQTLLLAPAFKTGNSKIFFGQKEGESDYFLIDDTQYIQLLPNIMESADDDR